MRKEWLDNIEALIRQEIPVVKQAVDDHKAGILVETWASNQELIDYLRAHGTRIEAAIAYITEHYPVKKPSTRGKNKSKAS